MSRTVLISLLAILISATALAVEPVAPQGIQPIPTSPLCGLWWNPLAGRGYFDYIEIQVVSPDLARVREHKAGSPRDIWTDWVFGNLSSDGRYLTWSRLYPNTGWGAVTATYSLEYKGWWLAQHRWASGPMGPFPPTSGAAIFVRVRGC
jgi:hypothetical protein